MRLVVFALVALLAIVHSQNFEDPVWKSRWCEDFKETFNYGWLGPFETTGKICYDWDEKKYAVYREDGHYDRYCGLDWYHIWAGGKCTHYVQDGVRYLHYPNDKTKCCQCCSADHGCGLLKPDWLSGAKFVGTVTFEGKSAYKWDQAGLQSNFYYETAKPNPLERVMLGIDQQPNDLQVFDPATFTTNFDESLITLPSECVDSEYCNLGICNGLRSGFF